MNPGPAHPEKNQRKDSHLQKEIIVPGEADDRVSPELPIIPPEKKKEQGWVNQLGPGPFSLDFSSQSQWRILSGNFGSLKTDFALRFYNKGPGTVVVHLDGEQSHLVTPGKTEQFLIASTTTVWLTLHPTSRTKTATGFYELILQL